MGTTITIMVIALAALALTLLVLAVVFSVIDRRAVKRTRAVRLPREQP